MKFSLLIPSYNRPEFIREAVLSLLANAAPDVEIIISDDASPRQAEITSILSDFIDSGAIKYIQQEKNLGWSNNRNALVRAAQGDYIILMGDDDRLKQGAIDCLRKWTAGFPDVSIFGFGYDIINEHGGRAFSYCTPKSVLYEMSKNDHWKEIFAYDAVPMWSHHPFTMCSKRKVTLAIPYNPKLDIADDAVYLCDALEQGHKFMAIPETLFEWRVAVDGGESYSTLSGSTARCYRTRGLILAEWLGRPNLRSEVASLLREPQFLRRFCSLFKESDVDQLRCFLDIRPVDGKALGDFICDRALARPASRFETWEQQRRAIKVMGFKHVLNFLRYKSDKYYLTRRLRRNVVGSR